MDSPYIQLSSAHTRLNDQNFKCPLRSSSSHTLLAIRSPNFHPDSLIARFKSLRKTVIVAAASVRSASDGMGFVGELRRLSMKMHTKDQSKDGEREGPMLPNFDASIEGYLKFLVDNKLIYNALERIVDSAVFPLYGELRNTGLERSKRLAMDLEWFRGEGHSIPQPSSTGLSYAGYLNDLAEKNPYAFLCHFYNIYFAHSAGGRIIGKRVSEEILENRKLEFYKWEDDLSHLLKSLTEKLSLLTQEWSIEEKRMCLEETDKCFECSQHLLNHLFSS